MDEPSRENFIEQVKREQLRRAAMRDYYSYVRYNTPGFKETAFHKFLCKEIDDFLSHDKNEVMDILLLSVPPQSGKSTAVTEALASYFLGKNPNKNVIIAGYSEDFARRFGRRNMQKIEEFGEDLFGIHPAEAPWNNTEFETAEGGRCISRGILSGITGNPANLIIIDDPIKNMQEAVSDTTRGTIQDEFYASIITRVAPHGKLIVIQTRWHEEDLFGHIEKNFHNVKVINLPCEAEENDPMGREVGEPLIPELGKGVKWLKDFKDMYVNENGKRSWFALYQGHPNIAGGNMFRKDNWMFYEKLPDTIPYRVISVDCTFKKSDTGDFVAIQDWGKADDEYYLIGRIKRRLSFTETVDAIRYYIETHGGQSAFDAVYIEDKANGSAVIDMLSKEFDNIVAINPEGGKESRAAAVSYIQENQHVWLPKQEIWVDEFINEYAMFPGGAHDDEVDAGTQALNRLSMVGASTKGPKRKTYTKWTDDMWEDFNNSNLTLQTELLQLWGEPIEWAV